MCDCSRVLEYAKIRTVLQSSVYITLDNRPSQTISRSLFASHNYASLATPGANAMELIAFSTVAAARKVSPHPLPYLAASASMPKKQNFGFFLFLSGFVVFVLCYYFPVEKCKFIKELL